MSPIRLLLLVVVSLLLPSAMSYTFFMNGFNHPIYYRRFGFPSRPLKHGPTPKFDKDVKDRIRSFVDPFYVPTTPSYEDIQPYLRDAMEETNIRNTWKISWNDQPDPKALEVTLIELLNAVTRVKTLIPAPDSYDGLHKIAATGCMTTPYTQTEPKDSYVDFLRILNGLDSNSGHRVDNLSVTFSPKATQFHQSTPKKSIKANSMISFNETRRSNSLANADLSEELLRWEKVKSALNKKKKKRESSQVKFTVRKSSETFASALQDGATKRDSVMEFNRDGDCKIQFGENEVTVTQRNSESTSQRSALSEDENEFHLPRYLSTIRRVKSKESVTRRTIDFDQGMRKYFDFEDYYDKIMTHSEE